MKVVEFLTFFLGILVGTHPVELDISGPVAEIEVRLDDRTLEVLAEAPWSFECDFGPHPEPHKLVAIARDERGTELDRATQWINLGHQTLEGRIILQRDTKGHPRTAKIDWVGIGSGVPEHVEVTFDGEPLDVTDSARIELPPYSTDEFHCLTAIMRFSGHTVRAFTSFGGAFGSEVKTELTAIPVEPDGKSLPAAKKLQSWFLKNGEPLEVHAIEKAPAEVIVVWDAYAQTTIESIARNHRRELFTAHYGSSSRGEAAFRASGNLGPINKISFMEAFPSPVKATAVEDELFWISPRLTAKDDGMLWLLRHTHPLAGRSFRLADAVASAGVLIQAGGRRRAVVLAMSDTSGDESEQHPLTVKAYLRQLRVPLYVWSVTSDAPNPNWGEVRFVGFPPGGQTRATNLLRAVKELSRDLERQRIVWLEGNHLPQSIELSDRAQGLHIAGEMVERNVERIETGGRR